MADGLKKIVWFLFCLHLHKGKRSVIHLVKDVLKCLLCFEVSHRYIMYQKRGVEDSMPFWLFSVLSSLKGYRAAAFHVVQFRHLNTAL